ncbi:hypothetical protein BFR04_14835 [Gaetbulibacter sp. 4G1]|nr:hypothetical protein BFR04_14835 [Gaetbulibacter sp. 4G1]
MLSLFTELINKSLFLLLIKFIFMKSFSLLKTLTILLFTFFVFHNGYGQVKIIKTGDEWEFNDDGIEPPKDWIKQKNIINNWKTGASPLGYGSSLIKTTVSYGSDSENKHITKYFKKTFIVDDPYAYLIYKLNVQRDDGIVIYLNGHEVMRDNMPDGEITNETTAVDLIFTDATEKITHTKLLSPDLLNQGLNTICASVHQARKISSDCIFNLEIIGDNSAESIPLLLKEQAIKNLSLDIKLKEVNHKQELEKKELRIEFIEHSKNNYKISLFIICGILLLCILAFLYVFRNFIKKEKIYTENILDLKEANKNKDREMMNFSLSSLNNKQYLKELKRELEFNIKNKTSLEQKGIKRIVNQIDYNLDHDEDWENLKKHFNAVHSGFFDKLIKLHPSLSEVELRHCIFIKLHMQTKEIANLLHIDPRSVQASRYRLKKKMNLNENTDLKEYLLSV